MPITPTHGPLVCGLSHLATLHTTTITLSVPLLPRVATCPMPVPSGHPAPPTGFKPPHHRPMDPICIPHLPPWYIPPTLTCCPPTLTCSLPSPSTHPHHPPALTIHPSSTSHHVHPLHPTATTLSIWPLSPSQLSCAPDAAPVAPAVHTHTATTPQLDITPGALTVLDSMHTVTLVADSPHTLLRCSLTCPHPGQLP